MVPGMAKGERFEVSLERLEKIVARLEGGDLSLEESLKFFEEGTRLAKVCQERLSEAEKKIERLSKDRQRRPFTPED